MWAKRHHLKLKQPIWRRKSGIGPRLLLDWDLPVPSGKIESGDILAFPKESIKVTGKRSG